MTASDRSTAVMSALRTAIAQEASCRAEFAKANQSLIDAYAELRRASIAMWRAEDDEVPDAVMSRQAYRVAEESSRIAHAVLHGACRALWTAEAFRETVLEEIEVVVQVAAPNEPSA